MKVLLVDDEKKFVMMLEKRLQLRGIEAHGVNTGHEAIETVKGGGEFDIAILDVKMPGIGGLELRRSLSVLDSNLKFVFLTGHGSNRDYMTGTTEAARYLAKPLKIDDLMTALHEIMSENKRG